ncbi:MAG: CHASE2 domain-containing protein [Spirochaetota bacterium]
MRKRSVELIVPVAAALIFAMLNFVPIFRTAEQRVYDLFLRLKSPIAEREEILLLDIDDTAISNVGLWPWSRDYMARGLMLLRELDSGYVTFDIEYVDESPQVIDGRYLRQELPAIIDNDFAFVDEQIRALFGALASGQIPLADAEDFIDQLAGLTSEIRDDIKAAAAGVVRDNDSFLGRAAAFHGRAYFTINILSAPSALSEDRSADVARVRLDRIETSGRPSLRRGEDVQPAISQVLLGGQGAGFPNVVVDSDGVRRRIDLVASVGDDYFSQLVMAPLLDWLDDPVVAVSHDSVTLTAAVLPGTDTPRDIRVPLATDGRMLINWPKAEYEESFRHLTYWRVVRDWLDEEAMVERLRAMEAQNFLFYYDEGEVIVQLYDYTEQLREDVLAGGDPAQIDEWRELRARFFASIGDLLESTAREELLADVRAALESGELDAQLEADYRYVEAEATRLYDELARIYDGFTENRAVLMEEIPGSFVIIGHVGTSTTDIGVTPFDEEYMNVGTHASVVNTILQQEFLDDLPWTVSLAVMFVIAALVTLLISRREPTPSLLIGFGAMVVIVGGGIALFLATGVFINMITPLAGVFLTFVVLTAMKFVQENRQKTEIRNAFGHYMSEEVVRQVTEDPSKLALGGVKKHLTAMFTDIRGFSSISESLEPEQLTELLNRYLGAMSDIVLAEGGTIDKFEGDAIIAFFGAPIDQADSAIRACRAAIAMKKKEAELNVEFAREGVAPSPIFTRIGINTGDMVVGNMGTATRMDYTAMGHNMNLAARLEGVNKQYGTWILMSEQTYDETKDDEAHVKNFTVRKLDRVRVVGINEPVRLYELVDLREETDKDQAMIEKLRCFNAGLTAFEAKEWDEAASRFDEVLAKYPEDGPAQYYAGRCRAFRKKEPARDWDGVFNLTKK